MVNTRSARLLNNKGVVCFFNQLAGKSEYKITMTERK